MVSFSEADLYPPVKKYFVKLGYTMRSEVRGIDATAVMGDILILMELKKSFNMKLLFQALERQKISPYVYVVIPRPKRINSRDFRHIKHIAKKLELGLITVAMDSPVKSVEVLVEPEGTKAINNRLRKAVLQEAEKRNFDGNNGGSVKVKLLTAFREKNIKIACILYKKEPLSARILVNEYGCEKDANSIMRRNYYGWFHRVEKGIYELTEKGRNDILDGQFKEVVEHYLKEYEEWKRM